MRPKPLMPILTDTMSPVSRRAEDARSTPQLRAPMKEEDAGARRIRRAPRHPHLVSTLQQTGGLLTGRCEAIRHIRPVRDIPERLDVVGADVLVIEVVRVLPDVEEQQRNRAGRELRLLVEELLDDQVLADRVPEQSGPARTLHAESGGGEVGAELVERPEVVIDRRLEVSDRLVAAVRREVRPEDRVV